MNKAELKTKCERVLSLKKGLEAYKQDFTELDNLTMELKDEPGIGSFGLQIVDNFAEKNTQWGHGSVRRWDIKIIAAPKSPVQKPKSAAKKV